MSKTDTLVCLVARSASGLLLGLLCGCMGSRAGLPLLYADPGVRVERPAAGVITYRRGMALRIGDIIQTADGYAVIDFDRGNVVDLRPNTRIVLGSISLFFGEMFARIVDVATHGGGQVFTDELTASVEGTQYAVRRTVPSNYGSNSAGSTSVIVRDGHVHCAPGRAGTWPAVVIGANFVLRVEGPRMLGPPGPIDAVAETRWSEEVERRLLGPRRAVSGTSVWLPRSRPRPRTTPPPPSRPAGTSGPS